MTTETDMDLFNNAISGEETTDSSAVTTPETQEQTQARDDNGRFTSETPEPVVTEPPTQESNGPVPVAAVQAERQKRQEAERRADELERRLAALEAKPAAPVQPQPEQQVATIWDDPDAFLKGQLTPLQQELANVREMIMEQRAEAVHGAEKLGAAKQAAEALYGKPEGVALHRELMSGGNPFDNLVKWHARQQTLATVGNDPQAWLQSELEKKMADPAFQAQVMERARAGNMPANGGRQTTAPLTNLPPSLSRIPSGGNTTENEPQSDADLFASVTRRK